MKDRILDRAGRLTGAEFTVPSALTTRDLRGTLVHTLDVELSWRARLQRRPEAVWKKALPVTDYPSVAALADHWRRDRKSTRLNSSHTVISYAVFCLKKKIVARRTHTCPRS